MTLDFNHEERIAQARLAIVIHNAAIKAHKGFEAAGIEAYTKMQRRHNMQDRMEAIRQHTSFLSAEALSYYQGIAVRDPSVHFKAFHGEWTLESAMYRTPAKNTILAQRYGRIVPYRRLEA